MADDRHNPSQRLPTSQKVRDEGRPKIMEFHGSNVDSGAAIALRIWEVRFGLMMCLNFWPMIRELLMNAPPLTLKNLSDSVLEKHKNMLVSEVNESCLRLAVNEGVYEWHHHPNSDELFLVLEGALEIQFQDQASVRLRRERHHLKETGASLRWVIPTLKRSAV